MIPNSTQMNSKNQITWGDIFRRWLARGEQHSWAAYKADQWEVRQNRKSQKREVK